MPTAYTYFLTQEKEISFPEWAMICARQFGALSCMREQPIDAPVPDQFKPKQFYIDNVVYAQERLHAWNKLPMDLKIESLKIESENKIKLYQETISNLKQEKMRYEIMLEKVNAWDPPSDQHEGLKRFMLEQVGSDSNQNESIEYYQGAIKFETQKYAEGFDEEIAKHTKHLEESVQMELNSCNKEVANVESRNLWIRQLRLSLGIIPLTSPDSLDTSKPLGETL